MLTRRKLLLATTAMFLPVRADAHLLRGSASVAPPPLQTPTYVQGNTSQNGASSSTTIAVTLANPVGMGNMLCIAVNWVTASSTDSVTSITDDQGNIEYVIVDKVFNSGVGYITTSIYLLNVVNAPRTITATINTARSFGTILVDEFSGVQLFTALDGHAIATQTAPGVGTDGVTSGAVTTTQAGDLIYGYTVSIDSAGALLGTSFSARQAVISTFFSESRIQIAAGSAASTWTATNGTTHYSTFVMAFKAATLNPSDSDFPSIFNRPVISNANTTLTWVGPLGGGANNGHPVQQTTTLTAPGSVFISSAQSSQYYPTGAIVSGSSYTIKQCAFYADDQTILTIQDGTADVIIEDCLFFGPGLTGIHNGGGRGIAIGTSTGTGNLTIRRCHFYLCAQHPIEVGVGPTSGKTLSISDCYIHDLQSNQPLVDHFDCLYDGGGVAGATVHTHNTYMNNIQSNTSAIFYETFSGPVNNVSFINNIFSGLNYNVYCVNKNFGNPTNITFTNNKIGVPAQLGYVDRNGVATISGNTDLFTGVNIDGLI